MHIFARIMFWLGVVGLAISLVSPAISSGASYTEGFTAAVAAFIFTVAFGLASVKWSSPDAVTDPFERARRSWSTALATTIALTLSLGVGGAVMEIKAQDDLGSSSSTSSYGSYDDPYASHASSYDTYVSDEAADGTWYAVYALVAAGLSAVWALRIAVRKPTPQSMQLAPHAYGPYGYAHSSYPPPHPQYGYAVQGTAPVGYPSQAYAPQVYGYGNGGGQQR
ncbi:MAG TPA: hypothetical protein VL400_16360 [Polyangiaceae bacterium]|jgi:hypothetical protein|nr:hypothetical protein [Polyangiaceae bacterium]